MIVRRHRRAEEHLAAALGLTLTWHMRWARRRAVWAARRSKPDDLGNFVRALDRFQRLGEARVDTQYVDGMVRARAQVGLILLSASIRRDAIASGGTFADSWREDILDALACANWPLDDDIIDAIWRLLPENQ